MKQTNFIVQEITDGLEMIFSNYFRFWGALKQIMLLIFVLTLLCFPFSPIQKAENSWERKKEHDNILHIILKVLKMAVTWKIPVELQKVYIASRIGLSAVLQQGQHTGEWNLIQFLPDF